MPKSPPQMEVPTEQSAPSLKDQAAAEEANAARMKLASDAQQTDPSAALAPQEQFVSLGELASYEQLHAAFEQQRDAKVKAYVPPPMTERQLSAREEEFEAGRRAVARATAQLANRPAPTPNALELSAAGQNTPVFRPGTLVPDPTIAKQDGSAVGGTRTFGE